MSFPMIMSLRCNWPYFLSGQDGIAVSPVNYNDTKQLLKRAQVPLSVFKWPVHSMSNSLRSFYVSQMKNMLVLPSLVAGFCVIKS